MSTMSDEVKGTVFWENWTGNHKLAYHEQIKIFITLVIFNLNGAVCVYGENAKQWKKPEKLTSLQ